MKLSKNRLAVSAGVFLMILFVFLYVAAISPYWKITPDSTTYVTGGESIASGKGYTEMGKPAPLFPPMTSFIFSLFLLIFPKNYFVLNAAVTAFSLCSLFLFFFLFSKKGGRQKSSLVILLSLGSVFLFQQSTFLLSDIFFMFFSASALLVMGRRIENNRSSFMDILAGILILGACMTRTVGLTLACAALLCVFWSLIRKKLKLRPVLVISIVIPLLFVVFWGIRNARLGLSYFDLFFQKEIYVPESGYVSIFGLAERFFQNLGRFDQIGAILINRASTAPLAGAVYARIAGLVLFFLGIFTEFKKKPEVQHLYVTFYLLMIVMNQAETGYRLFVPVLPLLFAYALQGAEAVAKKARDWLGRSMYGVIGAVGAVFLLIYLGTGLKAMIKMIPQEHRSSFGSYPIKYEANTDAQKLALWLRENSDKDSTFVCQHPNIWNIVTERTGYHFPFSRDQGRLMELISQRGIDYILVDKKKVEVNHFLIPVIEAFPGKFALIGDEKNASLYRVVEIGDVIH